MLYERLCYISVIASLFSSVRAESIKVFNVTAGSWPGSTKVDCGKSTECTVECFSAEKRDLNTQVNCGDASTCTLWCEIAGKDSNCYQNLQVLVKSGQHLQLDIEQTCIAGSLTLQSSSPLTSLTLTAFGRGIAGAQIDASGLSCAELHVNSDTKEAFSQTNITTPNDGHTYVSSSDSKLDRGLQELIVVAGSNSALHVHCSGSDACSGDRDGLTLDATRADQLTITVDANSRLGQNAEVTCPQSSSFLGDYGESCLIDMSAGGLLDAVTLNTVTGIQGDLWIQDPSRNGAYSAITVTCGTGSQWTNDPFDYDGLCWRGPTPEPSQSPTTDPTQGPTASPTVSPSGAPTQSPERAPTASPTRSPTDAPTAVPSHSPTDEPTPPTDTPTIEPTVVPTKAPTVLPTFVPSIAPTKHPTDAPTTQSLADENGGGDSRVTRITIELTDQTWSILGICLGCVMVACVFCAWAMYKKKQRDVENNLNKHVGTIRDNDLELTEQVDDDTHDSVNREVDPGLVQQHHEQAVVADAVDVLPADVVKMAFAAVDREQEEPPVLQIAKKKNKRVVVSVIGEENKEADEHDHHEPDSMQPGRQMAMLGAEPADSFAVSPSQVEGNVRLLANDDDEDDIEMMYDDNMKIEANNTMGAASVQSGSASSAYGNMLEQTPQPLF